MMPFIPMSVFVFAASAGFVDFNEAAKLGCKFNKRHADFMGHAVRCLVATKTHLSLNFGFLG